MQNFATIANLIAIDGHLSDKIEKVKIVEFITDCSDRRSMDITQFFEQSAGKWFSQRTSHDITGHQSITGKSDLWVDVISTTDGAIASLCQRYGVDSSAAVVAVRIKWDGTLDGQSQSQTGSTMLVAIADDEMPTRGRLLRQDDESDQPQLSSCYDLGPDEALTVVTETAQRTTTERIWFENPNVRFRTSVVKQANGIEFGSFCSEIRMGGAKP